MPTSKTFNQKCDALDNSGVHYTTFSAVNNNTGIYWSANGCKGESAYLPSGECIGEWDLYLTGDPETDTEPTWIYHPATYTNPNLDGAAICAVETRHWTECRQAVTA